MKRTILLTIFLALTTLPALAIPTGWHRTQKDGLEAARLSGKPLLVVTLWAPGA